MKLKKIEAICKAVKRIEIRTDISGDDVTAQWLGDGYSSYRLEGMPTVTPEDMLRIFDVPADKHDDWACRLDKLPESMDFSDIGVGEVDLQPMGVSVVWQDKSHLFFKDGAEIHAINEAYLKPFAGNMDYIRFHGRRTTGGSFYLCVSIGLGLQAVIMPMRIDEELTRQATEIAEALLYMQRTQK